MDRCNAHRNLLVDSGSMNHVCPLDFSRRARNHVVHSHVRSAYSIQWSPHNNTFELGRAIPVSFEVPAVMRPILSVDEMCKKSCWINLKKTSAGSRKSFLAKAFLLCAMAQLILSLFAWSESKVALHWTCSASDVCCRACASCRGDTRTSCHGRRRQTTSCCD